MDFLRSIYPPLDQRISLPALYVPTAYFLYAAAIFMPGKISRVFIILPLLVLLAIGKPFYTLGHVGDDYASTGGPLGIVLMFIDFLVICPLESEPLRFTGRLEQSRKDVGISEDDCSTPGQKFRWAARTVTTLRGIGWNVQVKGIPDHPDAYTGRWIFVRRSLLRSAISQCRRLISVYAIGLAIAARESPRLSASSWIWSVVIGWAGGSWAYNGVDAAYNLGAALTVAVGLCEPWEWPPMFGPLKEAWSVRQMWSTTWHQILRRTVQQPGVRLARLLGLRKGTLGSKYLQLYVAFALSLLIHEWSIFNAVRRDVGEFWFFAPQPLIITIEDFVQWCWKRYRPSQRKAEFDQVAKAIGYVWTFTWFSVCLPPFIEGLINVGIIGGGYLEPLSMDLGRRVTIAALDKP